MPHRARMERADFRLPAELKRSVTDDANRLGMDFSEYVRQTLYARLWWNAAILAATGLDPDIALDAHQMAGILRWAAANATPGSEPLRAPPPH